MNGKSYGSSQRDAPNDLRVRAGGGGRIHEVDPAAVEALKAYLATQPRRVRPPLSDEKRPPGHKGSWNWKGAKAIMNGDDVVDVTIYPEAVIEAAAVEAAKPDKRSRRYGNVFTPEVVAIWQKWKEDGRSPEWIGENNGLIEVPATVVHTYLFKHKQEAAHLRSQQQVKPVEEAAVVEPLTLEDTAVTDEVEEAPAEELPALDEAAATDAEQPAQAVEAFVPTRPENLPAYLGREYRQVPKVGDTLGNLIRLLNDERVTIEGEVDLRLNIKFGGK